MSWSSIMINRVISIATIVCTGLVLSGCGTINHFPTFDEARAETHVEMRKIVARIPAEAFRELVDMLPNSSFACGKNTTQYTGCWEVYVADTFDISAWFATLRSQLLSEGYRDEGYHPGEKVSFLSPGNNLFIAASKDHDDSGKAWIEIDGFSRCAQKRIPTTPAKVPPITLSPPPFTTG